MIGKFCAVLCGIAATWACAALGLYFFNALTGPMCRFGPSRIARYQVREVEQALTTYAFDNRGCPTGNDELIRNRYISPRGLVDPWGTVIAYACYDDVVIVRSAGPDRLFGTADDITNLP
jgi:hypothetical protein